MVGRDGGFPEISIGIVSAYELRLNRALCFFWSLRHRDTASALRPRHANHPALLAPAPTPRPFEQSLKSHCATNEGVL